MSYQLLVTKQFEKDFCQLIEEFKKNFGDVGEDVWKSAIKRKIVKKIEKLRKHPYLKVKKLSSVLVKQLARKYSIRVKDYRIICSIEEIKHKGDIVLYTLGYRKIL